MSRRKFVTTTAKGITFLSLLSSFDLFALNSGQFKFDYERFKDLLIAPPEDPAKLEEIKAGLAAWKKEIIARTGYDDSKLC